MDLVPIGIKSDQAIYQYCFVISSSGSLNLDERYIIVNSRIVGPSIRGIPPTKLELSVSKKIVDIIFPGSLVAGDATCYVFQHLTSPKFL
jgi:hypothetical protein